MYIFKKRFVLGKLFQGVVAFCLIAVLMVPSMMTQAIDGSSAGQQGDLVRDDTKFIDLTISLYADPTEDEDKEPYEKIIGYFADGVYESSNGAHKIRRVVIYTKDNLTNRADVKWIENCHPNAAISGRAVQGLQVEMCDNFGSYNFLADDSHHQGGGYTLAHEWGHYYYSLYDEYRGSVAYDATFHFPHSTDDPVPNSIMNSQWNAIGGSNFQWLNFSTDATNTEKTAQHRVYGASGWETLARELSEDPRDGKRAALPVRLYYPELADVAPAANTSPLPILPGTARSDLEIIWATRDTTFQIVIDNSGSMWGSPLANAKTAANLLVDLAEIDHATIGVIIFNTNAHVVMPLTPIVDQAAKDAIKTAINGISDAGMTNITEGAQFALDGLLAHPDSEKTTRVVYLLSDGGHTEGEPYPLSVIPAYQAAGIPLFTFGYGSYADPGLTQMAQDTGGQFYQSPTTLEDLQLVFQDAAQLSSSTVGIVAGSGTVSSAQLVEFPVQVDASISRLNVSVSYMGAETDIDPLNLRKPDNSLADPANCSVSGSEVLCLFTVENATPGDWQLEATNAAADDVDLSYRVSGTAIDQTTFYTALHSVLGTELQSPEPIVLMAYLGREAPISGAGVTGTIAKPDGTTETFTLRDDGVAPDVFADDGIYSALLAYDQNGVHTITVEFDNDAGTAKTNYSGLIPAIGPDGNPTDIPDPVPVTEDFNRFSRLQVTVSNYSADDHGDTTWAATNITTDNQDVAGRIDRDDDLDMFSFTTSETGTLVVRITNLGFGMNPRLRLIAANGTDILADVNLNTNATDRGYLALPFQASAYDSFFAEVSDLDGNEGGIYSISVGSSIVSDGVVSGPTQIFLPLLLK